MTGAQIREQQHAAAQLLVRLLEAEGVPLTYWTLSPHVIELKGFVASSADDAEKRRQVARWGKYFQTEVTETRYAKYTEIAVRTTFDGVAVQILANAEKTAAVAS
jgi:enamine deaminase RidA (YjgF/YER057c/UK114 family)